MRDTAFSDELMLNTCPLHQAAAMPAQLSDVSLVLDRATVLNGVSLTLGATGCTVIMGPNGAGKSLLLKVLHGLVTPSSGQVLWGSAPAETVTRRQALVFQKPVLLRRSVVANLEFVLRARKTKRHRTDELLDHVGLLHKARHPARLLSGGEAQRLALARALVTEPEVLLLDEPTASLDPPSVLAIEKIVAAAVARGVRVIFVTHDIGQARRIADDVVFLHHGRVEEHCSANDFFSGPESPAARDYLNGKIIL